MRVTLPWPPSSLSGHANGNWYGKSNVTALHRAMAFKEASGHSLHTLGEGDIVLQFFFTPPDNRSDRCNYYNRCKPYIDGIAEALGVNDKRFVPVMTAESFLPAEKPGQVVIEVLAPNHN